MTYDRVEYAPPQHRDTVRDLGEIDAVEIVTPWRDGEIVLALADVQHLGALAGVAVVMHDCEIDVVDQPTYYPAASLRVVVAAR